MYGMSTLQTKKLKDRFCCPAFLNYLRSLPCARCGFEHSTPAHVISRKRADGSDATCIDLCMACHKIFDGWGKNKVGAMQVRWGINIEELHVKLWSGFFEVSGIDSQEEFEARCEGAGLREPAPTKRKANFR